MVNFRFFLVLLIVFLPGVFFLGCAKPPDAEKAAAKASMDAAMASEAAKYAVAEFDTGRKIWENADILIKGKKYQKARQHYLEAREAFDKAALAAGEGKKTAVVKAQEMIVALEDQWEKLKNAAAKVKDRKVKKAWMADEQVFKASLKEAKGLLALDPAAAMGKINELQSIQARWEAVVPKNKGKVTTAVADQMTEKQKSASTSSQMEQKVKVIGNRDSKRYHLPGMKYYHAVKAYHRVEFDSEAEAIQAGYHKAAR
ncbi:MAG: hypothetical protein KBA28_11145 [Syntrophaceae bacterium]|jgi:colicin import membrane protein|nr:hypothetical protein [Syntrophaceae bacterium]